VEAQIPEHTHTERERERERKKEKKEQTKQSEQTEKICRDSTILSLFLIERNDNERN
jgi:hypothetical protein